MNRAAVLCIALLLGATPLSAQLSGLGRVAGADVTNSTVSAAAVTGLGWTIHPGTSVGFRCVLIHQGTATSGPRFGINGPAGATLVNIRWQRSTSATAQTQSNDVAFSAAAQTAAITTSGNTGVLSSIVYGAIVAGTSGGVVQLHLTSSTAGQTVTVFRGSHCLAY